MTKDTLARMIEKRDREYALHSRLEPERLILLPRTPATTRRICWTCRRNPYEVTWAEFMERYTAAPASEREDMQLPREDATDDCPFCGGGLVEVTL